MDTKTKRKSERERMSRIQRGGWERKRGRERVK